MRLVTFFFRGEDIIFYQVKPANPVSGKRLNQSIISVALLQRCFATREEEAPLLDDLILVITILSEMAFFETIFERGLFSWSPSLKRNRGTLRFSLFR